MQLELFIEGDGGLAGKADHAQAVGAVRGDLKLHHMVVKAQQGAHVVAGPAVLVQDEDAVGDAVGKLLLLGVQIVGGEDRVLFGIIGYKIARVDILAVGHKLRVRAAGIEHRVPEVHTGGLDLFDLRRDDRTEDLVAGLDVGRDGGLGGIDGMIVVQKGGGPDVAIGEVVRGAV